jgi:hypothetical protein
LVCNSSKQENSGSHHALTTLRLIDSTDLHFCRSPYPLEGLEIDSAPDDSEIDDDFELLDDSAVAEDSISNKDTNYELAEDQQVDEDADEFEEDEYEEVEGEHIADVGSGWARIVRTPIRRGRRTILDLCIATEKDGSQGQITRVVCSRRGNGAPLHPQARKSRWGDLWPC